MSHVPEHVLNCNDDNATIAQRDTVKVIIQGIEEKAFPTQLSITQLKKRPLSESLSCLVPHSPVMSPDTNCL